MRLISMLRNFVFQFILIGVSLSFVFTAFSNPLPENIKSIVDNRCLSCHSNGNIKILNYGQSSSEYFVKPLGGIYRKVCIDMIKPPRGSKEENEMSVAEFRSFCDWSEKELGIN